MIYQQVNFEYNFEKQTDNQLLLETSYYYPSPTLSSPLSSPTSSLILDDLSMNYQQSPSFMTTNQEEQYYPSSVNTTVPLNNAVPLPQDDWLLDPFYNFNFNPLIVPSTALTAMPQQAMVSSSSSSLPTSPPQLPLPPTIPSSSQPLASTSGTVHSHDYQFAEQGPMPTTTDNVLTSILVPPSSWNENAGINNDTYNAANERQRQHHHQHPSFNHDHCSHGHLQPQTSKEEPVSSTTVLAPSSTAATRAREATTIKQKKKSGKKKPVPYASRLLNLNFSITTKFSASSYSSMGTSSPMSTTSSSSSSCSTLSSNTHTTLEDSTLAPLTLAGPGQKLAKGKQRQRSPSAYQCDFPGCEKTFTRPYNLKSHRRTHTNEKPFNCPHCPKTFARQHDRNRHSKLHLGMKPFICLFCFKAFARQDALSRHQRWSDENHVVVSCSSLKRKNRKDGSRNIDG